MGKVYLVVDDKKNGVKTHFIGEDPLLLRLRLVCYVEENLENRLHDLAERNLNLVEVVVVDVFDCDELLDSLAVLPVDIKVQEILFPITVERFQVLSQLVSDDLSRLGLEERGFLRRSGLFLGQFEPLQGMLDLRLDQDSDRVPDQVGLVLAESILVVLLDQFIHKVVFFDIELQSVQLPGREKSLKKKEKKKKLNRI